MKRITYQVYSGDSCLLSLFLESVILTIGLYTKELVRWSGPDTKMLSRDSGILTPVNPPISAVGSGVIATDNDIQMDWTKLAPVRHVAVSVCAWLLP